MSGPDIITMGCRLNIADSEAMRALAADEDDLIIVNSCAVTNEAVRQARQAIRRAKRARPGARVIVTGCAAQIEPASFAAMPEVDRVIGNREKFEAASFRRRPESRGVKHPVFVARRDLAFSGVTKWGGWAKRVGAKGRRCVEQVDRPILADAFQDCPAQPVDAHAAFARGGDDVRESGDVLARFR